jgi:diaminopimelate decarboxylase
MTKKLPFSKEQLEAIVKKHPTPFHIYDEKGIRANIRKFVAAFSWAPEFKEYFAVKAAPNPYLMKILKEEGCGTDCSSLPELILSEKVGITGENIMFTSNDTPIADFEKAIELGAVINLDDITHLSFLEKNCSLPKLICFRYNPGPLREGNVIIGKPEEAKYGFTKDQLFEGYKLAKQKGVKRFGLHTMLASNELDNDYFTETAKMLFEIVGEVKEKLDIKIEFINLGGGIGVPYELDQKPVDFTYIGQEIKKLYESMITGNNLDPLKIFWECGRIITGPFGYLVSKVLHHKSTYKEYIGVDACMTDLMRPALYGAYHHITVAGKENAPLDHTYDVTGSLCENNDKFAVNRKLPEINIDDLIVIHDTGAHGSAMGFNYNAKLRSAEVLLKENGKTTEIRRAETIDDYFATLDFSNL